jgi:hypothetical protein
MAGLPRRHEVQRPQLPNLTCPRRRHPTLESRARRSYHPAMDDEKIEGAAFELEGPSSPSLQPAPIDQLIDMEGDVRPSRRSAPSSGPPTAILVGVGAVLLLAAGLFIAGRGRSPAAEAIAPPNAPPAPALAEQPPPAQAQPATEPSSPSPSPAPPAPPAAPPVSQPTVAAATALALPEPTTPPAPSTPPRDQSPSRKAHGPSRHAGASTKDRLAEALSRAGRSANPVDAAPASH